MLKKLVKYGNSNALVLDKAILELLNIQEGSVLKIQTDGKSIILTPHGEVQAQQISPTLSAQETLQKSAIVEELNKRYPHLEQTRKLVLAQKQLDLQLDMQKYTEQVLQNPEYQKELQDAIAQGLTKDVETWVVRNEEIMAKYSPQLAQVKKNLINFESDHNLIPAVAPEVTAKNYAEMQKAFARLFKKYSPSEFGPALQTAEYQHEAQLIAEKYQNSQQSEECLAEMKQLMYKHCPKMKEMHEEMENISKQYDTKV